MTIGKIGNPKLIGKLEFAVPLKVDTKKSPFCMSSHKFFLKYSIHSNNWVEKSVTKPVDSVVFHKIKALRKQLKNQQL